MSSAPIPGGESQASWCLRLVDGNLSGSHWPIGPTPIVIGRGLGCRLRLEDMRVSRIQCEVRLHEGEPRLCNRSVGSPTHLNGLPVNEASLHLGDLIEFAGHRILVDRMPERMPEPLPKTHPPTTRMFDDTLYRPAANGGLRADSLAEAFVSDLLSLFHFSRKLAGSESLEEVVQELRSQMAQRLHPDSRWVAWRTRSDGDVTLYPPASPEELPRTPLHALRRAVDEGVGLLDNNDSQSLIVAPLRHGGVVFGAIAAQRSAERLYQDAHLQYLLALAESVAPHIRAAERHEQWRRDAEIAGHALQWGRHLLGSSPLMVQLREQLCQAAQAHVNVLLIGETGTGKELAARMIHDASPRASGPYIAVNCAAIPEHLFESELFGHEKGAFTGASHRRRGYFEQAHGGTLLLDEVGDLSLANQARLLRAVETGVIRRLGAERDLMVDVRVISATNRPIPEPAAFSFRQDLYHRLAGIVISLPPLRERKADIPELAQHFLNVCAPKTSARPSALDPFAIDQLLDYHWPGNVRELKNVVERACYLAKGPVASLASPLVLQAFPARRPESTPTPSLGEIERQHLLEALKQHDGDVPATAEALGMPKSTLYYKLAKHGISLRKSRTKYSQ